MASRFLSITATTFSKGFSSESSAHSSHSSRRSSAASAALIEHDSLVMLRGSTDQMVEELCRRREVLGVSYTSVNAAFFEEMAPVVQALNGR